VIELRGTIRNLAKWFRLCERLVDRSPCMERNTDKSARVAGGPTSTGVLTRGQMARALREGGLGEARSGGTGGGVIAGAISRVDVLKYLNNRDLRSGCGCVTLAMLMAATITVAPTAGIPRNSANVPSSGPQPAGSIPRTPSPSVGDGNSVHPYVSDVNQGHQKKMLNKITGVTAAAVVGIAATVAGAQSAAVQWRVEDGGNGHWYELVINGPLTWTDARASCEQRGGHLVTPTSPSENALVTQLGNRADHPTAWVNDFGGNAGGPWLGGFQPVDAPVAQPWAWVTGEPWNWAGWAPGEPNGGFAPGISITCLLGYANSNYYRGWADAGLVDFPPYPLSPSYIIEWSADCNADNVVDYGQILDGSLIDENGNGVPDCCEQGLSCISCSACDLNPTGIVDGADLGALLAFWGPVSPAFPRADINRDGNVNGADLGLLLANWGPCGQ